MSIKIMTYVWKCSPVKGTELLMLLALADNANDDGVCYPSIGYLAHKARINERNAQKTIKSLAKKKLIKVERNAGKSTIHGYTNRYIVFYSDGVSPETPVSVETPLEVSPETPDGVSPETPKPSIEPSVKPSTRARAKSKTQSIVRDGIYDAIIKGWELGDDGLVPRIRTTLFEGYAPTDADWITRFVAWYKHKNNGLSLPIDDTKLKNWYGKFFKDPANGLTPHPYATNGTSSASEMQKLTEQRYKELGLK
jgi:hypothetical protein